jgi:hypothetical protein
VKCFRQCRARVYLETQTLLPRATQEYTDHFVMLFTPHGRISDAGRRVAHEKQHDPELPNELYRRCFLVQPKVGAVVVIQLDNETPIELIPMKAITDSDLIPVTDSDVDACSSGSGISRRDLWELVARSSRSIRRIDASRTK